MSIQPTQEQVDTPAPTGELMVPVSGEVIRAEDAEQVMGALLHLREWKRRQFDPFVAALEAALLTHAMDVEARYTIRAGGLVATGVSPQAAGAWEYQHAPLRDALRDAGLPLESVDEAIRPVTVYKVNDARMKLLAAHPRYGPIVEAHRTRVPKRRSVQVKRDS